MDDLRQTLALAIQARQSGDAQRALALGRQVAEALPGEAAIHQFVGEILAEQGAMAEASQAFESAVLAQPSDPAMRRAAALLAVAAGRPDRAVEHLETVAAMGAETPDDLANRADALATMGRNDEALAAYEALARLWPDSSDVKIALSSLLIQARRAAEAEPLLRAALDRDPEDGDALTNLALIKLKQGLAEEALALSRRAASLPRPKVAGLLALSRSEYRLGHVVAAAAATERAGTIARDGDIHVADAAANPLVALGRVDEALAKLRDALEKDSDHPPAILSSVYGKLLFCLQYQPGLPPAAMAAEAKAWNRLARDIPAQPLPPRSWDPERRLKIGYVSGDFRQHACAYYTEPLIRWHDKTQVEVFCYSDAGVEDEVSGRIKSAADHWRQTAGMSDDALAEAIRADGIDILVDLAGHTSDNRLFAFAHRPAPIQAATLIGYAATTGVEAMDVILGDPWLTPEGRDDEFTETVIRLPRIIAPFQAKAQWPAPAEAPPAQVVFASVADPARVDQGAVGVWEKVLDKVPGSRLLLKHNLFNDEAAGAIWRKRLGKLAERVDIEGLPGGWDANMSLYDRVTVVLDSPMHSGNTTVLIPLWMGVPVVSLHGANSWQRAGSSILANCGLGDLVAKSEADYVEIAARLATDRDRLLDLRRSMRQRLLASPVCDGPLVVGDIEAAYRALWREACAKAGA